MRFLRFVLPVLPFTLVVSAYAQSPPQRDAQALALLAQSMAVNAGSAGQVADSDAEGTITWFDGSVSTIRLKTKGLDWLRTEVSAQGTDTVSVVRGGRGHTTSNGTRRNLPRWATAYQRALHIPAISRLRDFARNQMNVVYVGLESVNDQPAHHIRLFASPSDQTPPEIEEIISDFHLFIDARTLLVAKTLSYDFSPDVVENRTAVETYFEDYRAVGGLAIPHRITRSIYGQEQSRINLASVRLNVGLPDSEFQ
jgi:hypothetical protein